MKSQILGKKIMLEDAGVILIEKHLYLINIVMRVVGSMIRIIKKIRNIIIGTWNNVFHRNNEIAEKRLKICYACDKCFTLSKNIKICTLCGCVLESKARVDNEKCELNLWVNI